MRPISSARLIERLIAYRRLVILLIHLLLVVVSSYFALWLRFDGVIPVERVKVWLDVLPALIVLRLMFFLPFRLYHGLWRYTSLSDVWGVAGGVFSSSAAFFAVVYFVFGITRYPRSVYLIDTLLLICFMVGVRLTRRAYREFHRPGKSTRVLVYGAGDAGEMIVRDMRHNPWYGHEPIGFLDDNRLKVGRRIHGLQVLGTRDDLETILAREHPDEILIAMPAADAADVRAIVRALEPFKIPITTLPNLRDILDGTVKVSQIRSLSIEDLLPRAPIGLDPAPLRALLHERTVMITGAGGSIGSELCRQIAGFCPKRLLLFERYENSLFAITNELLDRNAGAPVVPLVGDVADEHRIDALLGSYRPDVVFHAAAHKHVPLMEMNPCEAVKNNVSGMWVLARAAQRHHVPRLVLISTDKAVNPTSIMGVTKRVAELIGQAIEGAGNGNRTRFTAVRFGNVLGSNGSVVPRFLDQIRAGGPVTVTHPDIKRYFMLIPEAVQLVLHAAALSEGGEVFVLDMGEQIKVVDVARNLIRLSGLVPDRDIAIRFTGLRAGEKLFEELVGVDESAERLPVDKILRIRRTQPPPLERVNQAVAALEHLAGAGDVEGLVAELQALVPTFRRNGTPDGRPAQVPEGSASPNAARRRPFKPSLLPAN